MYDLYTNYTRITFQYPVLLLPTRTISPACFNAFRYVLTWRSERETCTPISSAFSPG